MDKIISINEEVEIVLTYKQLQMVWCSIMEYSGSHGWEKQGIKNWKPVNQEITSKLNSFAKSIGYEKYGKLREKHNF